MDKTYYGNMVNLSGLYSKNPVKCYLQDDYNKNIYWSEDGNLDIDSAKLGRMDDKNGYVMFTSENENDVKMWTEGVLSAMLMLKRWVKDGEV